MVRPPWTLNYFRAPRMDSSHGWPSHTPDHLSGTTTRQKSETRTLHVRIRYWENAIGPPDVCESPPPDGTGCESHISPTTPLLGKIYGPRFVINLRPPVLPCSANATNIEAERLSATSRTSMYVDSDGRLHTVESTPIRAGTGGIDNARLLSAIPTACSRRLANALTWWGWAPLLMDQAARRETAASIHAHWAPRTSSSTSSSITRKKALHPAHGTAIARHNFSSLLDPRHEVITKTPGCGFSSTSPVNAARASDADRRAAALEQKHSPEATLATHPLPHVCGHPLDAAAFLLCTTSTQSSRATKFPSRRSVEPSLIRQHA